MSYYHGVRVLEAPTRVAAPNSGTAGLQVVIGTAPVNMAADPSAVVNVPVLVHDFEEAKKLVGYCDDFANYSICEAIDATFRVAGTGPLVIINVLDPATHKTAVTEKTYTVTNGQVKLDDPGMIASSLSVKQGSTDLIEGTDYIVSFDDDGYCILTFVGTQTSVEVSGDKLNPAGVTAANIIGGVDSQTGAETGLECIRQVFPRTGYVPGLLISPKWSKNANIAAALATKCEGINGLFSCECIVDLDSSVSGAVTYTATQAAKATAGMTSPHMDIVWPCAKIGTKIYHGSAIKGAYTQLTDAENDDVPFISPSNIPVAIDGICTEAGAEIIMDETQANIVNSYGISTFNRFREWLLWGNRTAAYPGTGEVRDLWFCCRRFFSWWGNRFILTYHNRVDSPANFRLIEAIVDDENVYGNSLVAEGKCAGARIEYVGGDNNVEDILDGHVRFYQHLAPFTPAEDILNVLEFDPDMLAASFEGGE